MGAEGAYVAKRRIFHTRRGMARRAEARERPVHSRASVQTTAGRAVAARHQAWKTKHQRRGLAERRSGIAGVCSSDQQASYCKYPI